MSNIAKAKLDEVALQMKQDPDLRATVVGHADNRGSASTNERLSRERADAVREYLVDRHGIDPARITTSGVGSSQPIADNDTADGRAENRRAVIVLKAE